MQNKKYFNHIQILDSQGTFKESFNKFMHVIIGSLPPPTPQKILISTLDTREILGISFSKINFSSFFPTPPFPEGKLLLFFI